MKKKELSTQTQDIAEPKNKTKTEILAEEIQALEYGTIITHQQISTLICEDYGTNKYSATIAKARKILLKQGICLENIISEGYRIVVPDNFTDQALKCYKSGFRQMKKGFQTLEHAPTKHMSREGLETYRRVHDRAISLNASMRGASLELRTLAEKKHPFAIENLNH